MKYLLEILRMLDAVSKRDQEKVLAYARQLAEKIEKDGDVKSADRIRRKLESGFDNILTPTSLSSKKNLPVDSESRLSLFDENYLRIEDVEVFLPPTTHKVVDEFLRNIDAADRLLAEGLNLSASLLLYGPPGCGKTELAKYIAARLQLPLLTARSDSLISSYLGSTAKNLRLLFDHASSRPCVLFLDEFDALAKLRDDRHELGELKRVVVSLLQNIDAVQSQTILLAATNHEHLLDPAIWRRFSYRLHIDYPKKNVRENLFRKYLGAPLGNKEYKRLSIAGKGLSGSSIKDICEASRRSYILDDINMPIYIDVLRRIILSRSGMDGANLADLFAWAKENEGGVYTHQILATMFSMSKSNVTYILKQNSKDQIDQKECTHE